MKRRELPILAVLKRLRFISEVNFQAAIHIPKVWEIRDSSIVVFHSQRSSDNLIVFASLLPARFYDIDKKATLAKIEALLPYIEVLM